MSSELDALHKMLKDKTRRKIIILLNERGSLSYTDLKGSLEITNNGLLNFHLKVLNDLLTKNDHGQYILTERGKSASNLLSTSTEQESIFQYRSKGWKRLFVLVTLSNSAALLLLLSLTFWGYIDIVMMTRGILGFATSTIGLSIVYKMIRPAAKNQRHSEPVRTIQDIFITGRCLGEVTEEVQRWVNDEGIAIEVSRDGFIKGRLGAPSGLGLSIPKYFEVSFKPDQTGVLVHTEGWVSIFDAGERSFSKSTLAYAGVPRKKGWIVMETLWNRLKLLSK